MIIPVVTYQFEKMKRVYIARNMTHSLPIDSDFGTVLDYKGIDWFPESWVNWRLTML